MLYSLAASIAIVLRVFQQRPLVRLNLANFMRNGNSPTCEVGRTHAHTYVFALTSHGGSAGNARTYRCSCTAHKRECKTRQQPVSNTTPQENAAAHHWLQDQRTDGPW
jgi:hypothetical protein